MNIPINELRAVYRGDKMSCFSLLKYGIQDEWLPQVVPENRKFFPDEIPRSIVQYWHDFSLPDEVNFSIENTKKHNPGFLYHLACDESARAFIMSYFGKEEAHLFDACFHATMRSDFWRMCYLYEFGGIYLDVDTRVHAPLSLIGAGNNFQLLLTYSIGYPWCINNDFIITTPRNPIIYEIVKGIFSNVTRFIKTKRFENIWVETGPGITTMAIAKWLTRQFFENNATPDQSGLIFRHQNCVAESFNAVDMNYKTTKEGNWRGAKPRFAKNI